MHELSHPIVTTFFFGTIQRGGIHDAVRWQNGSQQLFQAHQRTDHVTIDVMNVLHIRNVVPEDAQEYHCWYGNEHVASITVHGENL